MAVAVAGPAAADPIFDSEAGHALFADVLRAASFGIIGGERAAFIIEEEDGSIRCELWPTMHREHADSFHGTIPPHTVAIVHTHPLEWPQPSAHDQQESARLDIPIYVLTMMNVSRVTPRSSHPDELVRGHLWVSRRESPERCAMPGQSALPRGESAGERSSE